MEDELEEYIELLAANSEAYDEDFEDQFYDGLDEAVIVRSGDVHVDVAFHRYHGLSIVFDGQIGESDVDLVVQIGSSVVAVQDVDIIDHGDGDLLREL